MKYQLTALILLTILLLTSSCGTVRNSTVRNNRQEKIEDIKNPEPIEIKDNRFTDTTIIKLPDITHSGRTNDNKEISENSNSDSSISGMNEFNSAFEIALKEFDNRKFGSAYQKFNNLKSTLTDTDSLYFESDFYMAECLISENKLNEAKKILDLLEVNKNVPDVILEKIFVRLGQIYCQRNDKKTAASYFSKLEMANPKSIYLSVANCNFLNNGSK
jgi:TolA-binding protein